MFLLHIWMDYVWLSSTALVSSRISKILSNRNFKVLVVGLSVIVDLSEDGGVIIPKIVTELKGEKFKVRDFNLKKYKKSRKIRFSDSRKFS